MKNFLSLAIGCVMLFSSCRYAECTNPYIEVKYELDSAAFLLFTFDTYEKGTGFSKLISSEPDSAYLDTVSYGNPYTRANHIAVDDKHDYIITIPATGKTYKISDIQYGGKTRVKDGGIVSEMKTACTRTVNYTVNGQKYAVEGSTYEIGYSAPANRPVITITK